ncbi:MAG: hypothetical protein WC973_03225 [Candidatus Dojkabacteria bacterium]
MDGLIVALSFAVAVLVVVVMVVILTGGIVPKTKEVKEVMSTTNYYDYNGRYGLLKDGVIVTICFWVDPAELHGEEYDDQDIFFKYSFFSRLKRKRKTAFSQFKNFARFSDSKRELRKVRKSLGIKPRV